MEAVEVAVFLLELRVRDLLAEVEAEEGVGHKEETEAQAIWVVVEQAEQESHGTMERLLH
jgi:hypothetical protein